MSTSLCSIDILMRTSGALKMRSVSRASSLISECKRQTRSSAFSASAHAWGSEGRICSVSSPLESSNMFEGPCMPRQASFSRMTFF